VQNVGDSDVYLTDVYLDDTKDPGPTVDGEIGWKIVSAIGPRIVVPMHCRVRGLSLSIRPLEDFLEHATVPVTRVGNEVAFEKEDFPDSTEVWVFSF